MLYDSFQGSTLGFMVDVRLFDMVLTQTIDIDIYL